MAKTDDRRSIRCSFCGKPQSLVNRLIAGNGAYICDECVRLCMSIIDEGYPQDQPQEAPKAEGGLSMDRSSLSPAVRDKSRTAPLMENEYKSWLLCFHKPHQHGGGLRAGRRALRDYRGCAHSGDDAVFHGPAHRVKRV